MLADEHSHSLIFWQALLDAAELFDTHRRFELLALPHLAVQLAKGVVLHHALSFDDC